MIIAIIIASATPKIGKSFEMKTTPQHMKNKAVSPQFNDGGNHHEGLVSQGNTIYPEIASKNSRRNYSPDHSHELAEILFLTSYPPRECGIATYSQDLIKALNNKFSNSWSIKVCALESGEANYIYPGEVKYILDTSATADYETLALTINKDERIKIVLIQHEFGFFRGQEKPFLQFLQVLSKPVIIVFHTVLPHPDPHLKSKINSIAGACRSIIVMTHTSADILINEYGVPSNKISVIAHGTHLVPHLSEDFLKMKYGLKGRKVLSTFGLLGSGKSIETTLDALPAIVKACPEAMFLVIGKTHPGVVKEEGEAYRNMLEQKVQENGVEEHVKFINNYLALPELLEYLQLTDIYLFTTNDPNQAVSGTFAYAMSCGCPIISTPIPHAKEVLTKDTGIIFDFRNSKQLADAVIRLLNDEPLRMSMSVNSLQEIVSSAWENSAVSHALLFRKITGGKISLQFNPEAISLDHMKRMTTNTGIIQFSKINQPDISSGYTLDDNARALVVACMFYKLTGFEETINDIKKYLSFINRCQQPTGDFLNYLDENNKFTDQNKDVNLDDANGRAIWALGYLVSLNSVLPKEIISEAGAIIKRALHHLGSVHSTRAMAFAIKGLYYYHRAVKLPETLNLIVTFADRLTQMFKHESNIKWEWYESYLTYANSILPEAMLYAWLLTGEIIYKEIAVSSFAFLLSQTFNENGIEVISNKNWLKKGQEAGHFGEQPIDVAYTIMTLGKFYDVFNTSDYRLKMETAFNWFLGSNRLHQIIYNPCTGGCYDGLEETHVNLNQGAESTVSYLMARLTIEKYRNLDNTLKAQPRNHVTMHSNQKKLTYSTNNKKLPDQPYFVSLPLHLE
jgi:glycosyltransferase involved in cell wall biosynthesis